uniref:Uncharacterized protein n=1 Tax=Helianthus annuus TaxID=4232 RepID=A0A251S4T9_HELAN
MSMAASRVNCRLKRHRQQARPASCSVFLPDQFDPPKVLCEYFIQFQDREKDFEHKNHLALLVLSQIIVADMVDRSSIRRRKSIAMDNDSGQSSSSTAAVVIGSQIVCESVRHSAILRAASFRCILDSLQFALLDTRASAQSSTTLSSVPVPTRAY